MRTRGFVWVYLREHLAQNVVLLELFQVIVHVAEINRLRREIKIIKVGFEAEIGRLRGKRERSNGAWFRTRNEWQVASSAGSARTMERPTAMAASQIFFRFCHA